MVITRSQEVSAGAEARRQPRDRQEEEAQIELERRLSLDPSASPAPQRTGAAERSGDPTVSHLRTTTTINTTMEPSSGLPIHEDPRRARSPAMSRRSNVSVNTRLRLAELEAAEHLAAIKRRELELEAELVKKRLAAEVSAIHDDHESLHEAPFTPAQDREKVVEWLHSNPLELRGEVGGAHPEERRNTRRQRSPTPTRRSGIEQLAATLEKMARPRLRHTDLPTFSGATNEWLAFNAAFRDTTNMYHISPAENIQRLRSSLKGEARDAVAALLHAASDPEAIMKTLEQCFGRPEIIIDRALEELKKMPKPGSSATDLNAFAVKVQNTVCVLKTIDKRGYLYNPLLAREVLDKLSPHLRSRWCDFAFDQEDAREPEIVTLSRFLMREADRSLRFAYAPTAGTCTSSAARREIRPAVVIKRKSQQVYAIAEAAEACPSCEQQHSLPQCPKYMALTVGQRWELVKEKKMCFKCIKSKHRRIACKAKACGVNECRRPHHPSLHEDAKPAMEEKTVEEAVLSVASKPTAGPRSVLLKICPVVISGPRGELKTHALLDEGATITLIDEKLARKVGAEGPSQPLYLRGVNMKQKEQDSRLVSFTIRGVKEKNSYDLKARTMRDLNLHRQSISRDLLKSEHLRDLDMEEVSYDQARPGILVGTDHWECIVSRELRVGGPEQPAASRTQLGWVVHGTIPRSTIIKTESVLHVYEPRNERAQNDQQLHELVERHFKIDALGVSREPRVSEEEQRAVAIAERSIKKINGGYEVGLPWRRDDTAMPPSYNAAFRRLKKIEGRMDADPLFAKGYTEQMNNLFEKGYAVQCNGSERASKIAWYLPHFAVVNPNKPGKLRLVFDAAARSNGVSLNDQLLEGPDMLLSLPGILFRFRERSIAVTADIQEMFLQINIRSCDQPAQQFLWRGENRQGSPRIYKMTRVMFGAASSPFLAHFTRNHNAYIHAEQYPRAWEAISQCHYMDDMVASYDDPEEARKAVEETRMVHAAAGFTLRGWNTNGEAALRDVPKELWATRPKQLGDQEPENKILGLVWNADKDELGFNTSMNRVPAEVRAQTRAPTKREALSAVMSFFDPLGILSHYTIRAKIILQSLWRLKIAWDDEIPTDEGEMFAAWLSQLPEIARLRLPRWYTQSGNGRYELHVFCDASEQAYAATAYWRNIGENEHIDVALVAAKAKVAPRKTQTIPRLELQAAVIGSRLADTIRREHRIVIERTVFWTDSSTVIHWVRHDARRYTPFVAHRLGEIAELTQKNEWRWLPTDQNVADDATRLSSSAISKDDRWFRGPAFLREPESEWPAERVFDHEEAEVMHVSEDKKRRNSWLPDPARFSKYETLVGATARVIAFVDIRVRRTATRLECRHLEQAELLLIQHAQWQTFSEEMSRITAARPIPKSSRLYRLDPVIEEGVLKVRGRIEAASISANVKRPIILDGRHMLTRLIVLREHCAAGHANRERVTNDLRQRYWILHLRPTVRTVERNCTHCRVRRTKPIKPITGDLPRARLDPFVRPFTNCGVDYFGPMIVKIGRRREKRWGALFTCLTSRAVHIEIVASLSTDSAIMALRRMAARRGWPRLIYSDNATNFRGADHELKAAYAEWAPILREEGLKHRMEWRFIPPGAPNQGGAWERLIRSVKTALNAALKEKEPTEEMLRTLLTEVEFSVNARPLTHVSVDPTDPEALTPNHFLLGSSTGMPTTGSCDTSDRRAWRASQALADHFWQRWVREYLPTLVPRGESRGENRPLQPGDIVAIADSTLPRNVWPLGVVSLTYPGTDGAVRVAEVRTKTGVFKRPVSRLVALGVEGATRAAPGGELLAT